MLRSLMLFVGVLYVLTNGMRMNMNSRRREMRNNMMNRDDTDMSKCRRKGKRRYKKYVFEDRDRRGKSICRMQNRRRKDKYFYGQNMGIKYLYQTDFDAGSIRIQEPGYYALAEDIVFDPLPNLAEPNDPCAWRPCNDPNFPGSNLDDLEGPFLLGFFAAIVLESDNVIINLCGHSMSQSFDFYVQQRFFAHIEVSNQVLINNDQGPFDPGNDNLIQVSNVIIKNGELGLSSHWGIHGLGPRNLILKNLYVNSFEVAGIHINGYDNLILDNVEVGDMSRIIPANYNYAISRDIIRPLDNLFERIPDGIINFSDRPPGSVTVTDVYYELLSQLDLYFFYITNRLDVERLKNEDPPGYNSLLSALLLFQGNFLGVADCASTYGIVLNSNGFATQNFGDGIGFSYNASLNDVYIHDMFMETGEVVGYISSDSGNLNLGTFGDNFQVLRSVFRLPSGDITDRLNEFIYDGNIINDAQATIAKFGEFPKELHGTSISEEVVDWVEGNGVLNGNLLCNQDIMNHLGKGQIGLRIDDSMNVDLNNIVIEYLNNWGEFGTMACGNYNSSLNGGHQAQSTGSNYGSVDVRGLSIHGSNNVNIKNLQINDINSRSGLSYGIDILRNNSKINFLGRNIRIKDINAGFLVGINDLDFINANPGVNDIPEACGINVDDPEDPMLMLNGFRRVRSRNINGAEICPRFRPRFRPDWTGRY